MFANLLFHAVDWYRPGHAKDDANADYLTTPSLVQRRVPCCVQPATSQEQQQYLTRSLEITHTVFVHPCDYKRNDVLRFGNRQLKVIGVRDLIELHRVMVLDCLEFEGADLRG